MPGGTCAQTTGAAAGSLSPSAHTAGASALAERVYTTKRSADAGLAQRCIVFLQSYHACCPDLSSYWRPTLTGLPVGLSLIVMFATVQAGLGLYLQACCHPCRQCYHEPEGLTLLSLSFRVCYSSDAEGRSSLLRGLHFARA